MWVIIRAACIDLRAACIRGQVLMRKYGSLSLWSLAVPLQSFRLATKLWSLLYY